uniref:Uncharacterized protein n=1 Tax=Oryza sativa subsp. japonica TaxID=39947 RepID=Q7F167_ORYSJ|nr:hypothetical protein [Oryza sativa Japonica Group]
MRTHSLRRSHLFQAAAAHGRAPPPPADGAAWWPGGEALEGDLKWPNGLSFFTALTARTEDVKLLFGDGGGGADDGSKMAAAAAAAQDVGHGGVENVEEYLSLESTKFKRSFTLPARMSSSTTSTPRRCVNGTGATAAAAAAKGWSTASLLPHQAERRGRGSRACQRRGSSTEEDLAEEVVAEHLDAAATGPALPPATVGKEKEEDGRVVPADPDAAGRERGGIQPTAIVRGDNSYFFLNYIMSTIFYMLGSKFICLDRPNMTEVRLGPLQPTPAPWWHCRGDEDDIIMDAVEAANAIAGVASFRRGCVAFVGFCCSSLPFSGLAA